jgi:hypothetical protein
MRKLLTTAVVNAGATALYVAIVGTFLSYAGRMKLGQAHPRLIPIAMLMLFVFSAAVTGALMLGRPILWYLDGKRKEAVALVLWTIGIFLALTLAVLAALVVS